MPYTNRSQFPETLPGVKTCYCFACGSVEVSEVKEKGLNIYHCRACGKKLERMLIYDPDMMQTFNEKGELTHYSAGIIVTNDKNEFLLFLRTKYPFLYTVPAGHIERGEDPKIAALRETREEVGIALDEAELVFEGEVAGDGCTGGADIHHWHLYLARTNSTKIIVNEEGSRFGWYGLSHIPDAITYPVRFFLNQDSIRKRLL